MNYNVVVWNSTRRLHWIFSNGEFWELTDDGGLYYFGVSVFKPAVLKARGVVSAILV